jgi:hypothetical protein
MCNINKRGIMKDIYQVERERERERETFAELGLPCHENPVVVIQDAPLT